MVVLCLRGEGWGANIREQSGQVLVLETNKGLRLSEAVQTNKKTFDRKETSPSANCLTWFSGEVLRFCRHARRKAVADLSPPEGGLMSRERYS